MRNETAFVNIYCDFSALAATVGVISPSGHEVGPFLSVEQAALSQVVENEQRTHVFAWYTLVASLAMAAGALFAGISVELLTQAGFGRIQAYRALVGCYAAAGAAARTTGAAISPFLASILFGYAAWVNVPFFLAGGTEDRL